MPKSMEQEVKKEGPGAAKRLAKAAERLRQREAAIARIKTLAAEYSIRADEVTLGFRSVKKDAGESAKPGALYRSPIGQEWIAKHGRRPRWLVDLLNSGMMLIDLEVKNGRTRAEKR